MLDYFFWFQLLLDTGTALSLNAGDSTFSIVVQTSWMKSKPRLAYMWHSDRWLYFWHWILNFHTSW